MEYQDTEVKLSLKIEHGYQCSGSLVENGKNVSKDLDEWAGNLRIPTPKTAVGLKDENTLVFLVVDGRQPEYSEGVTGSQLADILISLGVTEAAILDGGASSELIYNGEIANRPSTEERYRNCIRRHNNTITQQHRGLGSFLITQGDGSFV